MSDFLAVYTPDQVSLLHSMALQMRELDLQPTDIIAACESYWQQRIAAPAARPTPTPATIHCPSCGRGLLRPVHNPDGLLIMGCPLCRWSTIINQENL